MMFTSKLGKTRVCNDLKEKVFRWKYYQIFLFLF